MASSRYMTTAEAAQTLGTDVKTVRGWVNSGRLPLAGRAGRTFLLDPTSVQRIARYSRHRGRSWAPGTAWAAIHLVSGGSAGWLIPQNRSRLRSALRASSMNAERMQSLARMRSTVRRYRGHRSVAKMLTGEVVSTGTSAIAENAEVARRFGLASGHTRVDGYVGIGRADSIAADFALTADPAGDIVLREADLNHVTQDGITPLAVVALDLMDSLATRERSAGKRMLAELLTKYRDA